MKIHQLAARPIVTVALLVGVLTAACGLDNPQEPTLIGPGEFALSIAMTASPDVLPRDGSSQSVVTLVVRGPDGRPIAGQRLGLGVDGPTGTRLSATEVTTASDGRATVTVTAPTATGTGPSVITVFATPIGNNFDNAQTRQLTIALTGLQNTSGPTALFTFAPTTPEIRQQVTFDASTSTDEGRVCADACTYSWSFGDGSSATGRIVTKAFQNPGRFDVTLTVRDAVGLTSTRTQAITVNPVDAPRVTGVTVSPNPPVIDQQATFTATATVGAGHNITRYEWNFGDGTNATTGSPTVTKTYNTPGTFTATVTAVDELGQTGRATTSFTITSGITPVITYSPTNPRPGETVNFSASGTTTSSGAAITSYLWEFGDGDTSTEANPTNSYPLARTYVVRLTVTDSRGRTATTTREITVVTTG